MKEPELLSDPIGFWEQRHVSLGAWRSGGDRGLGAEENYEFYAYRLGRIIELIRRHAGAERGHRILDAGCGRGFFVDALRRCGHRAHGIDASPTAIAAARESHGDFFEVSALDAYRTGELFPIILSIDVLFHVLDDAVWRASLANFSRLATAESMILLTDVVAGVRYASHDYVVHRSRAEYDQVLGELGYRCAELVPYDFGANPNQFAVYRRTF
jgi:2-polyprenyl-3-methyl-5-hydroxy-6-metoxy-1,4-benzoquinol methylase